MNERKNILVAVDFSYASLNAWHQAGDLANVLGAKLQTVHVLNSRIRTNITDKKRAALRQLRELTSDDTRTHVLSGNPVEVVLRLARDIRPDLVVMGTHGRVGLKRLVLGSVAEAVIRRSPVPVLTVREEARPIDSILAPIALTHYAVTEIAQTAMVAVQLNASSLTFLHIIKGSQTDNSPQKTLEGLIERLPKNIRKRCRLKIEISEGDPTDTIVSQAANHDLIAIVFHQKEPLKEWIFGTTAERVLERSPIPVLTLPYVPADAQERKRILASAFISRDRP